MIQKTIVQFIHAFTSGGAENVVKNYCVELQKRGYDVRCVVLYSYPELPYEKELRNSRISVTSIFGTVPKNYFLKLWNKGTVWIRANLFMYFYINRVQPDVLHVHLHLFKYLYLCHNIMNHTRMLYTCHSLPSRIFGTESIQKRIDLKNLKWFLYHKKMRIIALHSEMKEEIDKRFHITTTEVLHNPIDITRFEGHDSDRKVIRSLLSIPEDAYVVGHIGSFTDVKNHKKLVKIFGEVKKSNAHAFLLMVGSGELKDEIEENLKENGQQGSYLILENRSDIPQLLASMDVFCFPSKFEGLANAFVEAQLAGLKCVVSDTIPKEAIISDRVYMLGVEECEVIWSKAVLCEEESYEKCISTRESFDIQNVIASLEQIYWSRNEDEKSSSDTI